MNLPNPLHPALVHFPIVLILLGTVIAVVATFASRPVMTRVSALVWVLPAVGATAAVSLAASWSVMEAGHYGGRLVYQHGVGVSRNGPADAPRENSGHQDDD